MAWSDKNLQECGKLDDFKKKINLLKIYLRR